MVVSVVAGDVFDAENILAVAEVVDADSVWKAVKSLVFAADSLEPDGQQTVWVALHTGDLDWPVVQSVGVVVQDGNVQHAKFVQKVKVVVQLVRVVVQVVRVVVQQARVVVQQERVALQSLKTARQVGEHVGLDVLGEDEVVHCE